MGNDQDLDDAGDAHWARVAADAVTQWKAEGMPAGIPMEDIACELGIDLTVDEREERLRALRETVNAPIAQGGKNGVEDLDRALDAREAELAGEGY